MSLSSEAILIFSGVLLFVCNGLENATLTGPPIAAAVRSHFDDCPDTHQQFCFHGTCRFFVQESAPACICHPGFIGTRCEHADILAVVAIRQKQQAITTLVVASVVVSILLTAGCVFLHCCWKQKKCELCRRMVTGPEASLLKIGSPGSRKDTGV
ncbi:protransforming growth factor alpha-like isoform X2 [Narcine bancroftii]|uniref:protransforming growth factor alpha-like isoform X2 n=1 Tax=Narcine bancroftii TaxID=1343680 RepID=UPI003831F719